MSLNDKAYCATPTIVRDAARFVTLDVSGAASVTGLLTLNNGFTVTDGSVSFGGQSHTEVLGSWVFTYGFISNGDTYLGNSTTTSTLTVIAAQSYTGAETHNGVEEHNGTCVHNGNVLHNGDLTLAGGRDVANYELITASGVVRAWNSANNLVLALSTGGGAITMSAPGGHIGVRKFIKCASNALYSAQVIDGYSGNSIYTLSAGQSCFIVSDGTRWV